MGEPGDLMPVTVDVPFHTGDGVLPPRMTAGDEFIEGTGYPDASTDAGLRMHPDLFLVSLDGVDRAPDRTRRAGK